MLCLSGVTTTGDVRMSIDSYNSKCKFTSDKSAFKSCLVWTASITLGIAESVCQFREVLIL